ncbi:MAG: glucose-6-phosphate dehydrogenase [Dehalococcoidia bacterium]|nr:glucose-6-phosphate dehydrogenase [Dehalococcoidia bacterium]HRC62779.1 glucose-6-phosphate dehydrogenase [Dehalococcoidia bacterium]
MALTPPLPQDLLLVGASGDLAQRKLIPGLYNLELDGLLPPEGSIIGYARHGLTDDEFRNFAADAVKRHSRRPFEETAWSSFARRLTFISEEDGGLGAVAERCRQPRRLAYLAIPPSAFMTYIRLLADHGLVDGTRIVIEKPFGNDLATANQLDSELHQYFHEDQIFRIDHYLGKETVQNILVFRFGNSLFERVWNRDAVDHVQITVAESIGVEGRGQFYEEVGALRDIMQNHVFQILSLLTMEPPSSFRAEAIRDEKAKLLESIPPVDPRAVVRGQYTTGALGDQIARGYRDEPDVSHASNTETFVAMRLNIQNWRWEGVPFYLRTGKRMPETVTEVTVVFREAPIRFFSELPEVSRLRPNQLSIRIQPEESITFSFLAKEPGPEVRVQPVRMHFSYLEAFGAPPPEAYERLLHDAMEGDQTLFLRADGVEEAWRIIEPVLSQMPPLRFYAAGSWGPPQIDDLIEPRRWRLQ